MVKKLHCNCILALCWVVLWCMQIFNLMKNYSIRPFGSKSKWKLLNCCCHVSYVNFMHYLYWCIMSSTLSKKGGWRHTSQHNSTQSKYTITMKFLYHENFIDILWVILHQIKYLYDVQWNVIQLSICSKLHIMVSCDTVIYM
jgi:hypothetical protein